ncbi:MULTISPECIES: hypothetical protein [Burkholderia]|uniref:hypothetical protein n=1 Tax=Burkholderia TaxID=32008 RepID=UPI001640798D|nr:MULTISPECIES: hypothetical protein [Burkholderia]
MASRIRRKATRRQSEAAGIRTSPSRVSPLEKHHQNWRGTWQHIGQHIGQHIAQHVVS